MPRAGRPEQPLVTDGPVSQLAGELRRMRERAGLTYAQLSADSSLSIATLRGAASGNHLPTLKVTRAFVSACDGDQDMAWALWEDACRAAGRDVPGQPPTEPPDPGEAASAADLTGMFKELRLWADSPSLAELNRRAGGHNLLPKSTLSDMLNKQQLPPLERMLTFVRACGLDHDQAAAWRAAWERLKAQEDDPLAAAFPPSGAQPGQVPRPKQRRRLLGRMVSIAASMAVILAALTAGNIIHWSSAGNPPPATMLQAIALQFVYTARTANDAAVTLPAAVQQHLLQAGLAHQSVTLTRIGYTGNVSTSVVDMTPRTGNSGNDPVLKVTGREVPVIDAKISGIQTAVNSAAATTGGGRALFTGLTRITLTDAPVTIISSGLDLANPDNFRALSWLVPPAVVVTEVKKAGALPALHGPVTFVLVPTADPQPQLGQAQKNYIEAIWTALLKAAGATSVTFIDANGTTTSSAAPSAPTIPIPDLPTTPVPQVPAGNNKVTCTVPDSYFRFGTAALTDPAQAVQNLTPCIDAALAAHATFALDGWTSYEGPLNADGKPEFNYAYNITLSDERVQTIAALLVNDLGVSPSSVTHKIGHGNMDQPNPDPRSAANRVVVITYTVK